ncbi:cysteine--tRNA ligase [Candidatus Woesearchaeota archaeon]|nr:cysteine--tRNA ligase [Candidatus Woesearchaeota archaeon]
MKFFNTLTRKDEEFKPLKDNVVRMYTCGPTIYNFAHIGNFRTYVFEDLLRRYLKYKGYKIKQVMNLTDVDDKTIKNSIKEGKKLKSFTDTYKKAFFEDVDILNIERAEVYPAATEHVLEMIEIIKVLIKKGYAYQGEDKSWYYNIAKFNDYGKLSHMKIDELKSGARVKQDEYEKENVADFALWKAWDENDGDVFWDDDELGKGRPGWHIECSAMSMKHLSDAFKTGKFIPGKFETFDIHTGGVDNMFPHHEDEIAQSEAATGKKFVNIWMHSEHLLVDGKKMSKSLGNFYTLRDLFAKGFKPMALRYVLISTHYRQQLNFTFDGLNAATNALQRIEDFVLKLKETKENEGEDINSTMDKLIETFEMSLDNDLNIAPAMGAIFEFIKKINGLIAEKNLAKKDADKILKLLIRFNSVLGFIDFSEKKLDNEIEELVREREAARKSKNWAKSDMIRDVLKEKGIVLEDTAKGVRWKYAK